MPNEDNWADDLEIPSQVPVYMPDKFTFTGELRSCDVSVQQSCDFYIKESFQPGIFTYQICIGKVDPGTIFLRAFEITQNAPLSVEHLKTASAINVDNPTDQIVQYNLPSDHFKIYEGDWGKTYAARFELWHKATSSGLETKLVQKNYIIEGWQR